jgi:hypothetical protein
MHTLLEQALTASAEYWPPLRTMFDWIGQAARILDDPLQSSGDVVRAQY